MTRIHRSLGVAAATLILGAACASSPQQDEQLAARNAFERDRERCVLSATRALPLQCPSGPCSVAIPNDLEFEQCMERRGWPKAEAR